jgi:hypothetical protein
MAVVIVWGDSGGTMHAARLGQIGAWLLVAIAMATAVAGLIVSMRAGAALGGPFYFAFYLGLAAVPLIAGMLALGRPSRVTYVLAAVLAGVIGTYCLLGLLFSPEAAKLEPGVQASVLLVGLTGLASALCFVASLQMARGSR